MQGNWTVGSLIGAELCIQIWAGYDCLYVRTYVRPSVIHENVNKSKTTGARCKEIGQ